MFSLSGLEGDEGWCATLDRTSIGGKSRKSCGMYTPSFLLRKGKLIPTCLLYTCLFVYIAAGKSRILHDNILKYILRP